ncbi:SDR family NAD(P)-dependent oxidoreductase [Novosphingobium taihuense]|uniref:NAD(P)-dependent dehydrogenase (Short-subunit alcohol dehydrogenase family) n=1 Tax=Novosphingobium taihuense TaxID=260085 RepID=A0A7W7ADK5_9SPHN|nr:SDR family oxidoreductase [Novosphingobium taihuense]MBB4615028.1 NAD(P)-dependent dehydrogenase (short-subunit alcohol dehydrogenase family) [Novosphingobium taihuense]
MTGSSSGIGAGIAQLLADEGAIVIVHGRDRAKTEAVVASIREAGGQARSVIGSLDTSDGCETVAGACIDMLGGIDVLVNNAGGKASGHLQDGKQRLPNAPWLETPWEDWRWTYEQNMGAAVRLIQKLAPGMIERGFGRIINIASASGTQPPPDLADYCPAKAAMINMSSGLAKTLGSTGVTVNTVTPGTIMSPAVKENFTGWAKQLGWADSGWEDLERRFTTELMPQPIKRFGRPDDIARMVALIASPLSSYMTGSNYRVDGGFCLSVN